MNAIEAMMFVVAVLSLLVTILIGWQIYTIIDIKRMQKYFMRKEKEFEKREEEAYQRVEYALGMTFLAMGNLNVANMQGRQETEDMTIQTLSNYLYAIQHFQRSGNYKAANDIIDIVCDLDIKACKVTEEGSATLRSILLQTNAKGLYMEKMLNLSHFLFKIAGR